MAKFSEIKYVDMMSKLNIQIGYFIMVNIYRLTVNPSLEEFCFYDHYCKGIIIKNHDFHILCK